MAFFSKPKQCFHIREAQEYRAKPMPERPSQSSQRTAIDVSFQLLPHLVYSGYPEKYRRPKDRLMRNPDAVAMLVSRNLPPLQGGMERLNQHVFLELRKLCKMVVVGPKHAEEHLPDAQRVLTCPGRPISSFLCCCSLKAAWAALLTQPALVLAGSGANALPAWFAATIARAPWGVYLHGLDILAENFWYQRFMLPIIRKADFFLVNSQATADVAKDAMIPDNLIHILHPGMTFPERLPSEQETTEWRRLINVDDRPLLLSVGRLTRRKGLLEFIINAFPAIVASMPNACLVIVGSEPDSALNKDSIGPQALMEAASKVGISEHVRFLGRIDDEELSLAYRASNIHIFPVLELKGDMEGFGMVSIEAAAHGLPTIAFKAGGVADAIRPNVSGSLVPPGDYELFATQCTQWLSRSGDSRVADMCREFSRQFEWKHFGESLRAIPPIKEALA